MSTKKKGRGETIVGKLRAADPFELIRWLARSQPDPRKALAELVQNSVDAGAREIRITRLRERGVTALHILDDGEGVIPELTRTEALTYLASHIGHSRKRNLTPAQRRELLVQGKYGIGLLGFWAIGQVLEMRTQLPGQPAHLLRLFEDSPRYEIERVRGRLTFGDHYTEVIVRALHRPAFLSLTARRMTDYLAAELRGQLLARDVKILVYDRIARGRAPKILEVQPARFEGQRLALPEEIATDGFAPIRVELYLVPLGVEGRVSISAAGTTVYDNVADLDVAEFRHPPWTDHRLSGLLDFADFQVAPAARRGVFPDRSAAAFATALRLLEPLVLEQLHAVDERAAAEVGADILRQLERAFRDVPRFAPEYDFFAVRAPGTAGFANVAHGADGVGETPSIASGTAEPEGASLPDTMPDVASDFPSLLPASGLDSLHIMPAATRVERLGQRRRHAIEPAPGSTVR